MIMGEFHLPVCGPRSVKSKRASASLRLGPEILFWLIVKLALLTLIYLLFFRPDQRPQVDIDEHLLRAVSTANH